MKHKETHENPQYHYILWLDLRLKDLCTFVWGVLLLEMLKEYASLFEFNLCLMSMLCRD